jgi:hypothetical protein
MLPHAGQGSDPDQTTSRRQWGVLLTGTRAGVALVFALLPLFAGAARAQSLALPAVIEFDHDGVGVTGFVLYATRREDGAQRRIDVRMPAKTKAGRWQVTLPTLEKGTWRLELAAYNGAGESPRAKADPPEVRIDPKISPKPPAPPAVKAATKPPPAAQKPTPPPQKTPPPPKKKKGAMGKLWSLIVGDDEP